MGETRSAPDTALDFDVQVEQPSPDVAIVTVVGDADLHSAPELRDRLTELMDEGVSHLVLDLSETTFVDSMTLGVLLGCVKRLRAAEGSVEIVVPRDDIRRIFEITMLDRVFDLRTTRDQVLAGRSDGRETT